MYVHEMGGDPIIMLYNIGHYWQFLLKSGFSLCLQLTRRCACFTHNESLLTLSKSCLKSRMIAQFDLVTDLTNKNPRCSWNIRESCLQQRVILGVTVLVPGWGMNHTHHEHGSLVSASKFFSLIVTVLIFGHVKPWPNSVVNKD